MTNWPQPRPYDVELFGGSGGRQFAQNIVDMQRRGAVSAVMLDQQRRVTLAAVRNVCELIDECERYAGGDQTKMAAVAVFVRDYVAVGQGICASTFRDPYGGHSW
jgi:hypothetical protein